MFRILNFIILIFGLGFLVLRVSAIAAIAQFLPLDAITTGSARVAAPMITAPAPSPIPPPVRSLVYQACAARPGAVVKVCGCIALQTQTLAPRHTDILAKAVRRAQGADSAAMAEALTAAAPHASYQALTRVGEAFARASAACLPA